MNTGPRADGRIAAEDRRMLRAIGRWFRTAREALENVEHVSHKVANRDVLLSRSDSRTYYVTLHQVPATRSVQLRPFITLPARAAELTSGQQIDTHLDLLPWDHELNIAFLRRYKLPQNLLNQSVAVVKLEFDRPPRRVANFGDAPNKEP